MPRTRSGCTVSPALRHYERNATKSRNRSHSERSAAKSRNLHGCVLRLLFLALIGACGGLQVPAPDLATQNVSPLPPAEPAVIALPISISLGRIRNALTAQFPVTDSLTQAQCVALGGVICHQYVYRRDSLELRINGDRIDLNARLRYRG